MPRRRIAFGCLCASILLAGYTAATWADAGELFPNVKPYNDEIPSPVTKPRQSLEKPNPPQQPPEAPPLKPAPPVTPKKNASPEFVIPKISWASYQSALLAPMLSPESQTRFDKDYAPKIKAGLDNNGVTLAKQADQLWQDAQADDVPPDLKTAIWLHALGLALRSTSSLDDRAAKAKAVLPLLKDDTLAVAQARVDAVTGLAFGAISKASDSLLAMALESECKLARMQVQCGFIPEAQQNRSLAKDILGYLKKPTDTQKALFAETSAWVERATAAQNSVPGWKKILTYHPENTVVNTQMAELSIALFGDLIKAAPYAVKSDRPDLKTLAALIDNVTATAKNLTLTTPQSFTLGNALLSVAESAKNEPFDRYAIALMVQQKMADLAAEPKVPPAISRQAAALESRAAALIAKSGFTKPAFPTLAALQSSPDSQTKTPGTTAKLQLFVKDNGTVVKYVKPTASQNAEALKLIRDFAKDISDKSNLQFTEIETDHCLIFTNWSADQQGFLKKNVEGAYLAVAKVFDYPINENVFPGKLPVFMLATHKQYLAFTKAFSGKEDLATGALFDTTDTGIGFLLQYKPEPDRLDPDPLANWGKKMTFVMVCAFEARYRTNKEPPEWLEDGLADRIALARFPDPVVRKAIHFYHDRGKSIEPLLTLKKSDFVDQCVMSSIVEMLMDEDKKQFIELLNKVKDGEGQNTALKETFHYTPEQLNKAWQTWFVNTPN